MNRCYSSYHRAAVAVTTAAVLGWLSQPTGHAASAWSDAQQAPTIQGPPPESRGGDRSSDRRPDGLEVLDRETRAIPLGPAGLLELKTASGDITVTTGRGREVQLEIVRRVRARSSDDAKRLLAQVKVVVDHQGDRATVAPAYEGGRWRDVRPDVTYVAVVPAGTRVAATTVSGHVHITDVRGEVTTLVTSGSVTIERASHVSSIRTISGTITLTDVSSRAGISVGTVSGRITADRVKADRLDCESVSGSIALQNVEAARVNIHALSGPITFAGPLAKGGRYEFQSHSGNLQLLLSGAGYQLQASSFSGAIQPEPNLLLKAVTATPRSLRATVGDGSATVVATTFSGQVGLGKR